MTRKAPVVTKRKRATGGIKFPLVSHDSIFAMRPCGMGWRTLVSALGGPVAMKKMGKFNPLLIEETNHQGDLNWLVSSMGGQFNKVIPGFNEDKLNAMRQAWRETRLNPKVVAMRHKVFMEKFSRRMQ